MHQLSQIGYRHVYLQVVLHDYVTEKVQVLGEGIQGLRFGVHLDLDDISDHAAAPSAQTDGNVGR